MNRDEYLRMHAVEDRMWWYRGLHANLLATYQHYGRQNGTLLDAGCGTGGFLHRLEREATGIRLFGIDREPLAAMLASEKTAVPICVGSVDRLPFATASLATITCADVLYHRAVDEAATLAEFHRCLAPGGALILNVPCYEWMRSAHDRAVHTARRYTAGRIAGLLHAGGFVRIVTRYWNSLLFPLMVLRRKLFETAGDSSDVSLMPRPIEALFSGIMRLENAFLRRGLALPFGGSVLAVGFKP